MIVSAPFSAARPSVRAVDLQPSAAIKPDVSFDMASDRDFARAVRQRLPFPLRLFNWEGK